MNLTDIIRIANQCGWDAEPHFTDNVISINFNRKNTEWSAVLLFD